MGGMLPTGLEFKMASAIIHTPENGSQAMPQEKTKNHTLKAVPKIVMPEDDDHGQAPDECPKCYGTGMEILAGKGVRMCSCRKLRSQHGQFESVRLPKRYDGFHFGNYKPQNESQTIALKSAM